MNGKHTLAAGLILLALSACGGGGGDAGSGGGSDPPPAGNPPPPSPPPPDDPPVACTPEADAVFPAFVYVEPGSGGGSDVDFRLASSDGCRTESLAIEPGVLPFAITGVYASGTGFVAWDSQESVKLVPFDVSGSAGAEVITTGQVETVLVSTNQYYSSVDAWRNEGEGLLVILRQTPSSLAAEVERALLVVDIETGGATELWTMTAGDQLACFEAASDTGANPYLVDDCVMPGGLWAFWSADGRQIYFSLKVEDQPGFENHNGTARLERKDEIAGCRGSLPDLGNGWCGPEIVHTDLLDDPRFPDREPPRGGRPRPGGIDGAPALLATDFLDGFQQSGRRNQRIAVLDIDACAELYDDSEAIEPLLAAGEAWRHCLYDGTALQEFGPAVAPEWTLDWQRLYYQGFAESTADTIRVFNPTGIPTDGDHEVVSNGRIGRTLR